ncbi:MAG: His/Gly/Thr/Pro-type tRNA ligase C-terminal domain-containing protein [bacterium]|nr:His/Gly/Thr/Pro-type tRNA ligase C-terminal domain-containing protein [bacterium]
MKVKPEIQKTCEHFLYPPSRDEDKDFLKMYDPSGAHKIATHYGFIPCKIPSIKKNPIIVQEFEQLNLSKSRNSNYISPIQKAVHIKSVCDCGIHKLQLPLLTHYFEKRFNRLSLDVIGTAKPIAEAILIKVAYEILKENGRKNLVLHINSVGDRDSLQRFGRELSQFYRKKLSYLHPECIDMLKQDVFSLFSCPNKSCVTLRETAPKSMNFLSENSREHFKEVLEFMEMLEMPYEIDNNLVGNRAISNHILFEIRGDELPEGGDSPLAVGMRHDSIARRVGIRKDLPSASVSISLRDKSEGSTHHISTFKKPLLYFAHLGFEAKLKSLGFIETLRQANIPFYQAFARDKISSQMAAAENLHVPFTIIMGYKEAMEGTVIVRNMATREQNVILLDKLIPYLRQIL